jgi:hypothetical protein
MWYNLYARSMDFQTSLYICKNHARWKNGNWSDSSDSSDDGCIEDSILCEIQEIEWLEQWFFGNENGINVDSHEIN